MLSLSTDIRFAHLVGMQAKQVDKSMEKLSSGLRVNRASDDAAGLGISENMRAQVKGDNQAAQNIQEAIQLTQIAEDGVGGLIPILHRMRELCVEAANGTTDPEGRQAIQDEIDQERNLLGDAYTVARNARIDLNGANPINRILTYQVGADEGQTIQVDYNNLRTVLGKTILGLYGYSELYNSDYQQILSGQLGGIILPPPSAATEALVPKKIITNTNNQQQLEDNISFIDDSIEGLTGQLAYLGAKHNELEASYRVVMNSGENMMSTESHIRDVDMADEMTTLTRHQILQQSSLAMISQANMKPVAILGLLRGLSK